MTVLAKSLRKSSLLRRLSHDRAGIKKHSRSLFGAPLSILYKSQLLLLKPATYLMNWIISFFSIVPEPSLANSLKHWLNSLSKKLAPSAMSGRVSMTNALVSFLSRYPELYLSYLHHISSTPFAITASI